MTISLTKKRFLFISIGCLNIALIVIISATNATLFAQSSETRGRNNPYSPSPAPNSPKPETTKATPSAKSSVGDVSFVMQKTNSAQVSEREAKAETTFKITKAASVSSRPPTETYKIGIGDVLFVNLKNSPNGSGYYTVRENGTIDFPLAGTNVVVAGQTTEMVEEVLASDITLYSNPIIEVKVRHFASHKITVSGLVENAGEKSLQREAMPLYVIRAEAAVKVGATKALVTSSQSAKVETYDLRDAKNDNVLIYPGNAIEFVGENATITGTYFIGGEVASAGQRNLLYGMTLYQALVASGGTKGDPKRAIIRRKNEKGMLSTVEHNLILIKDGKAQDPVLVPGDIIEIQN